MAVLILLSSIIWEVDVVGNETIPEERILAAAKAEGLHPLQWSFRLKTPDELSRRMLNRLPELSWIGFDRSGTKVTIKVVEAAKPQEKEGQSPRNLISTSDAVITEIIAERGKPAVRKNMRVKKGDVLISGWIGSEENRQAVVSEGTVRGLVWHEYDIVSPLVRQYKVYTGESKNLRYLVVGKHALKLTGYGKRKFDRYETISDQLWLHWRDYKIPLGWLKEKEMEVAVERQTIGKEEAAAAGLERAKADIWSRYGRDAVIREQKILHEKTENGKVYMKVLFEVEQNIAQEQPIVHIQGE
jgi:similar to stage IV sporulation protein